MAALTVWRFDRADGAAGAESILIGLSKQQLINVYDAAAVEWQHGRKRPRTRQLHNLTGAGALGGTFWTYLFGLLFFVPLLGAAIGTSGATLGGSLADGGIDDDFIESVKAQVKPGTSALFLLSSDAVADKIRDAFAATHAEVIRTNLSEAEEATLRGAFSDVD